MRFHILEDIQPSMIPETMNSPFDATPHPLCMKAAGIVREHLASHASLDSDSRKGKMFGVLIAMDRKGNTGFIAAFSGLLDGKNDIPFFAPPVYDILGPEDFFRRAERILSEVNGRIERLENETICGNAAKELLELEKEAEDRIEAYRKLIAVKKAERDRLRASGSVTDEEKLTGESRFMKAELSRLKKRYREAIAPLAAEKEKTEKEISILRNRRRRLSAAVQERIFRSYILTNAEGQKKNILEIFRTCSEASGTNPVPPAGTGDCAGIKMLNHAFLHGLKPVAFSEFWIGESPRDTVRKDGCFYPACNGKCRPLMTFLLRGTAVRDENAGQSGTSTEIEIIYEDDCLIAVNKPAGILSVPGRSDRPSLAEILESMDGRLHGLLPVHRLDMDTSGILLLAKDTDTLKAMQRQFENRSTEKTYIAVTDGIPNIRKGIVDLPLSPDIQDRPRQKADPENGRPAVTEYETISEEGTEARIIFRPVTGRTHQIRVHAAHRLGLGTPVKGDRLYGTPADRLYLHAMELTFRHPRTGKKTTLTCKAGF